MCIRDRSAKEREGFPMVGASIERRVFEYTQQVYNDDAVRALICTVCARIRVDTGRARSEIDFKSGAWLFRLPPGNLRKNFSKAEFERRYQQVGSPLTASGSRVPDFSDGFSVFTRGLWPGSRGTASYSR